MIFRCVHVQIALIFHMLIFFYCNRAAQSCVHLMRSYIIQCRLRMYFVLTSLFLSSFDSWKKKITIIRETIVFTGFFRPETISLPRSVHGERKRNEFL